MVVNRNNIAHGRTFWKSWHWQQAVDWNRCHAGRTSGWIPLISYIACSVWFSGMRRIFRSTRMISSGLVTKWGDMSGLSSDTRSYGEPHQSSHPLSCMRVLRRTVGASDIQILLNRCKYNACSARSNSRQPMPYHRSRQSLLIPILEPTTLPFYRSYGHMDLGP